MIVDKIKTSNITVSLEDLKPEMSTQKRNWKELTWHIDLLELSSTLENPFFFANKDKISSCLEYLNIYFLYFAKNCKLTMGGNTRKKENQKRKIGYWTSKSNGIFLVQRNTQQKLNCLSFIQFALNLTMENCSCSCFPSILAKHISLLPRRGKKKIQMSDWKHFFFLCPRQFVCRKSNL